jgi:hypothetical protein
MFPAIEEMPEPIPETIVYPVAPTATLADMAILLFAVEIVTFEPFVIETAPVNEDAPTATLATLLVISLNEINEPFVPPTKNFPSTRFAAISPAVREGVAFG